MENWEETAMAFCPPVAEILPDEERRVFLANPMRFRSATMLFRGLRKHMLAELFRTGEFSLQMGQMGGIAVFVADNPLAAIQHVGPYGAITILDRLYIRTLREDRGIWDVESPEFRREEEAVIAAATPEERESRNILYTAQNGFDLSRRAAEDRPWRTVELRLPQPIEAVRAMILVNSNGIPACSFDPKNDAGKWIASRWLDEHAPRRVRSHMRETW